MATDVNNIPAIALELRRLRDMRIEVGPILDEEVKQYAGVHEFGATITVSDQYRKYVLAMGFNIGKEITIPERSYIRSSFADKSNIARVRDEAAGEIDDLFNGTGSADAVAQKMGEVMVEIIQEKIMSGVGPENSPVTIGLKGHGRTLMDTGALFESIGARIV